MPRSFSCFWVSGMKRLVLGLEGWLRVAVDGSNRFGRDLWPWKIRSVVEGCGYDGPLFWVTILDAVRVMEIVYDGSILRLEGCPKDNMVGGSKIGRALRIWEKNDEESKLRWRPWAGPLRWRPATAMPLQGRSVV
ncbi:hypothetical protein GW17_00047010, partial [Ensete ventricosum]